MAPAAQEMPERTERAEAQGHERREDRDPPAERRLHGSEHAEEGNITTTEPPRDNQRTSIHAPTTASAPPIAAATARSAWGPSPKITTSVTSAPSTSERGMRRVCQSTVAPTTATLQASASATSAAPVTPDQLSHHTPRPAATPAPPCRNVARRLFTAPRRRASGPTAQATRAAATTAAVARTTATDTYDPSTECLQRFTVRQDPTTTVEPWHR